jgi:hypothetical protein
MNKKQSSIEWLTEKISYQTSNGEIITYHKNIADLIQQAKAMHKEEIQTSHECGQQSEKDYNRNGDKIGCRFIEKSEQYYNETFGGEK